jgi:Xaa-Pro aminopeptidase
MLRAGAEYANMAPASGPGTWYLDSAEDPRRVIREGDMVFIDMIIHVHGYLGDMTRAGIVGKGTAAQREVLNTVKQAYRLATGMMAPGARAADIYQAVVDLYAEKGWEKHFVHHLSHGLGLGGDLPRIARGVDDALRLGDALSCEPGLYIPGIGGARVENMLYIGDSGLETLTRCPLELPMGF